MAAFTAQNIGTLQNLNGLNLSPDGSKLVYRMSNAFKDGEHATASIWYSSNTEKEGSARQITSGLYNDGAPKWHPDARVNTIYFLSDRHKQGGPKQLYKLSLDGPGEPCLLDNRFKENKSEIQQFQVSPDGRYISFSSADEPTSDQERKKLEKDDAQVWGEVEGYARLRLYDLSTGEVRTIVEEQKHVVLCTWSPESNELLYFLRNRPDAEASYETTSLFLIPLSPSHPAPTPKHIATSMYSPNEDSTIWPSADHREIFTVQTYNPDEIVDSLAVYRYSLNSSSSPHSGHRHFLHGKTDGALGLLNLQHKSGEFISAVASGMKTRIDVVSHEGTSFTLFETSNHEALGDIDVKKVNDEYVLATLRSSGPEKEPPNVWVMRNVGGSSHTARMNHQEMVKTKLSSHFPWMLKSKVGNVERFEWKGEDGVPLDGLAWFPEDMCSSNITKPLPTILQIHGGPHSRNVPEFNAGFSNWQPTLAEQGYLVLSPNYRGSSGRGHEFARAAYHNMGTIEWSDVNSMVDEAIKRGLADESKLAITGWSQGGFLTAWGVSQTKNKFRCGIMGAGISDWGSLACESDLPDFEESTAAHLGGAAPWIGETARLNGDAIRHAKDIETAMLILHGEKDPRVPVGQAIGFHRGLRRVSKYPERHTLVIYPRETHVFTERRHAEDVIKRIIAHCEAWLK